MSELLTAVLTILCAILTFWLKECADKKACYAAIMTELKVLKEIFESTLLKEIEAAKKEEILWFKYPLGTDYFAMYNTNCDKIGKISDEKKRDLVVSCYTLAKYFLDCLKTNNECVEYYENIASGKIVGTKEGAEFVLKHSFNNNIIPTTEKMKELLKNI